MFIQYGFSNYSNKFFDSKNAHITMHFYPPLTNFLTWLLHGPIGIMNLNGRSQENA